MKTIKRMKFKVASLLLGIGLAVLGPAAHTARAQYLYPSGNIAVSQQFGLTQTDVFSIDTNGTLNVDWVSGGGAWHGPQLIGPPIFILGGSLAVSQQFGLTQTDVFSIDQDGQLEVFWVAGGGAWQGPMKIGPSGLFLPGAQVVASRQFGLNQTDVFAVDKNGQLEVFWVGTGAWQGPQKIGAPVAGVGSYCYLAAGRQVGLNQTDVFLVDEYGRLEEFWVSGGGAWQGPKQIGATGLADPQFTSISVSQQIGLNQTDVFLVDNTGQLDVFYATGGGAWQGPQKIGVAGLFKHVSTFVAASQQFGLNQTDVFAIDANDQLDVFWVDGGGPWGGPLKIGSTGLAQEAGDHVAVSQQFGLNQTDVFMIDEWENLLVFWVDNGGAWNGPLVIQPGYGI